MNPEKLAKLQAQVRIGGKGTPRRKVKKAPKNNAADDKKLQLALKKLNVQPLTAIDEVNMFQKDGTILHFDRPAGIVISSSSSIRRFQYVCHQRSRSKKRYGSIVTQHFDSTWTGFSCRIEEIG
jgi:hypothetical protein